MRKLSYNSKVTEANNVSDLLLKLYSQSSSLNGDRFLQKLFDEMRVISESLTIAIRRDRVQSTLTVLDRKRDEVIRNLSKLISGYASATDQQVVERAKRVKKVFDKYGLKMTRENYAVESSLIKSLLEDVSKNGVRDDINGLQYVNDTLQMLRDAENEFTQAIIDLDKAKANDKNNTSASKLKRDIINLINSKLLKYLDVVILMDKENYDKFTLEVYEIIDRSNAAVAQRTSKKSDTDDEVIDL